MQSFSAGPQYVCAHDAHACETGPLPDVQVSRQGMGQLTSQAQASSASAYGCAAGHGGSVIPRRIELHVLHAPASAPPAPEDDALLEELLLAELLLADADELLALP